MWSDGQGRRRDRRRPLGKLRLAVGWITFFGLFASTGSSTSLASGGAGDETGDGAGAGTGDTVWKAGELDPARGLVGRWRRELKTRQAALAQARGTSPRAILPLLGAVNALQGEIPNEELSAWFASVRDDRGRHPLVRAHAAWSLGRMHEADGRLDDAAQVYADTGFLTGWRILGPFDDANRVGHDAEYGPEQEAFSADQSFVGKLPLEALSWRVVDGGSGLRAFVSFDELLWPNTRVCGYATSWVEAKRAQKAAIHLGTGGPYKVWVNGELVGEGDVYRHPHPLQDAHALALRKGWNRVLLKLCVEDGVWGFYARLSTPAGAPLPSAQVSVTSEPHGAFDPPVPAKDGDDGADRDRGLDAGRAAPSLRGELEKLAQKKGAGARAKLDLVQLYRWVRPFAEDDRTAVELAEQANAQAQTAESAWEVALLEPDQNDSRVALVQGIARARAEQDTAQLGTMLLELAWRYRTLGLERRARELVAEAAKASPDDALIELARLDQLSEDGFGLASLGWLEDMLGRYPDSGTLLREKASRLMDLGRTRQALSLLEQLTRARHSDGSLIAARIEGHMRLGEVDEAARLARRSADAAPGSPDAFEDLARVEQARGDYEAAVAALNAALAIAPQDAELHAKLGQALSRAGDRTGSIRAFQRSLELKPQQPDIRDTLAALDPGGGDDMYARYGVDLEQVASAFEQPKSWKGKEAGVLHHRVAVRVHPNGLSERLDHRIIRVLDDRGVDSQALQAISYDPEESYVEVRRARVRRADGTIEEIGSPHVVSLAEAGFRMYYDQRQVRVKFQGLRVGDTLEVAFVRRDVAARNMFDEYFGDIMPLQGIEPRKHVEYVLEAPSTKPLYFNHKVKKRPAEDGKSTVYVYARDDVPGIQPESSMPGWSEVADYLHVSTYESWDAVGKWYWGLVEEQLLVNDEIREAVKATVAALPAKASKRDRVDAIYRHVIRSTRYVGLEFGIHGYKPYRTTEIYDRRFGDCKDKASLLKVMLGEAGIESNLVLVRTRDQGALGDEPASLAGFNHAIVYVPEFDLFLDGTAEWSGPSELPANDQGASVLVIRDGKGATFRRATMSKPADNQQWVDQKVTLQRDGDATVEQSLRLDGVAAAGWRIRFQSPDERVEELTKVIGGQFPRTEVRSAKFPGIDEVLAPVRIQARLEVPAWGRAQGDLLRFPVLGRESSVRGRLAAQADRRYDLVLTAPSREVHEIRYELPRGMHFSKVPSDKDVQSELGSFSLKVESDGHTAKVRSQFELSRDRVSPQQYRDFREFLRQVDAGLAQSFEAVDDK